MLAGMAHIPRVYTPEHLSPGPLTLSGDTARRLTGVMRISPGEPLLLFGGDGREWRATVQSAARGAVLVAIEEQARQEPPPRAIVETWIGVVRANRLEIALEKCVEAGADIIRPVVCAFSQRGDEVSAAKVERWQRIVIEAAEQSGRLYLPVLQPPTPLTKAIAGFRGAMVVAESGGLPAERVRPLLPETGHIALVVGPEGGLSAAETAAMKQAGAVGLSLGPYILRTETAAIVGTAVLRSLTA